MGVKDYDLDPDNNTQINGINIAEGCPPSGINNAMRQLMADVKEDSDAQSETLKKFSETPASAEELGPVKVGDGLTMGEDGTLSLDLVDGVDSTSTTQAPTAAAVKKAYDKASELDWIGVPRYWRSTNLPPNSCWANGDFVEFADWPELKQVYEAGGFEGMLLPWDADSETKAANLGMWRPDAANPTGLFTPNLGGQFFRNWAQGNGAAGGYSPAGLPEISGGFGDGWSNGSYGESGAFHRNSYTGGSNVANGGNGVTNMWNFFASRSNPIYGRSDTVTPANISQPVILYLGRPA